MIPVRIDARARRLLLSLGLLGLLAGAVPAAGQVREVHGENSVFAGAGTVIVWGILRTPVEDHTQVVMRIAFPDRAYAAVAVDAVDPFSRARRPVLDARPLASELDVRSLQTLFADFPRREIHLYRTAEGPRAGPPAVTIYYLGVPDTTPEFTSEAALIAYLTAAVTKARAAAGKAP
ncbi:MAG TPA: hypothetical protein VJB36_13675 [Methylomirabilota bacterium]|nr:hypothetical protein [Methylomirabilota bacterium]